MDKDQKYILSSVSLLGMDSVDERIKKKLDYEESDFILSPYNSRNSSKIIDENLAGLLKQFESPKTFAEAIFEFSKEKEQDPMQMAEQAFPELYRLRSSGFIIPEKPIEESESNPVELRIGEKFNEYKIIKKLQGFEDTEVYKLEDNEGKLFALKVLFPKKSKIAEALFQNELEILNKLDGKVNPKCIESSQTENFRYLILDWKEGKPAKVVSEGFSNLNIRANIIKLLNLCIKILETYQHLHHQNILHGDIHSGNVLITDKGEISLIDFGYSCHIDSLKRYSRAGVAYHYEPEFAQSFLKKNPTPSLTEKGEQYSIATLLYLILTGRNYIDFSLEKEKVYQQILDESPLPINFPDNNLPKGLDKLFSKALDKNPENRYSNLEEFKKDIIQIREEVYSDSNYFISHKAHSYTEFPNFLKNKFGWGSKYLKSGLIKDPVSSINLGAGGISYMFYRMSGIESNPDLLNLSDIWVHHALNFESDYQKAFYSPENNLSEETIGKRSLYHSPTGVYILQALIEWKKGNQEGTHSALMNYLKYSQIEDSKLDLTLGKTGLLIGSSLILKEIGLTYCQSKIPELMDFTNEILKEIWEEIDQFPSIGEKNPMEYYGIAHGWAGILYASLLWCTTIGITLPNSFYNRLDQLERAGKLEGNVNYWPISISQKQAWPGWCHGSAGYSFLWALVYRVKQESKYLVMAEKCLNHSFSHLLKNANLCCGISGMGYATLNYFQASGDKTHLIRSKKIIENLMESLGENHLRNNSLYRGELGIGLYLAELENPEKGRMPFFQ